MVAVGERPDSNSIEFRMSAASIGASLLLDSHLLAKYQGSVWQIGDGTNHDAIVPNCNPTIMGNHALHWLHSGLLGLSNYWTPALLGSCGSSLDTRLETMPVAYDMSDMKRGFEEQKISCSRQFQEKLLKLVV
jgi:hypothetical protein